MNNDNIFLLLDGDREIIPPAVIIQQLMRRRKCWFRWILLSIAYYQCIGISCNFGLGLSIILILYLFFIFFSLFLCFIRGIDDHIIFTRPLLIDFQLLFKWNGDNLWFYELVESITSTLLFLFFFASI